MKSNNKQGFKETVCAALIFVLTVSISAYLSTVSFAAEPELSSDEIREIVSGSPVPTVTDVFECTVHADGESYVFPCNTSNENTVSDILDALGIVLGEYDYTDIEPETVINGETEIYVHRVEFTNTVREEKIEATCKEIPIVYGAFSGNFKKSSTAKDGVKVCEYRVKTVDGEVCDEVLLTETVTKKPVSGVKYVDRSDLLDKRAAPTSYVSKLRVKCTAYTYCEVGGMYTALDTKTKVGYVAVDPKVIPYRSLLYIVLDNGFVYGYAYAMDCGVNGNSIDLFLPSLEDCADIGVRSGTCYIVRRGK